MEGVLPLRSPLTLVQVLIREQELLSPSGHPAGPLGPWQFAALLWPGPLGTSFLSLLSKCRLVCGGIPVTSRSAEV